MTRSRLGAQTGVLGPLPLSSQTRPRKFLVPWKPQLVSVKRGWQQDLSPGSGLRIGGRIC